MPHNLDTHVGKNIRDFCQNGFTADNINHCAHFVSHALGLDFSYSCREHTGGGGPGANIRVHEMFANCPLVGAWADADLARTQIIFVTRASHVNVGRQEMVNHPQKHVGIFHGGKVYHYSNTNDRVITQSVDDFFDTFERVYDGTQGLYFGLIPGSNLDLNVDLAAAHDVDGIGFAIEDQTAPILAKANGGADFYVGDPVKYLSRRGLFHPASRYYGPVYRAEDYHHRYDHWAFVIEAIGYCEGKNHFNLINTYDGAAFTFGFVQFAAHTPDDNLILLFRELLHLDEAADYFPELELRNGHVHRVNQDGSATDLEAPVGGDWRLRRFMHYLNPDDEAVGAQELLHASRLIHWANTSEAMRNAQVKTAIEITSQKVINRYHRWYDLTGRSDLIVTLIADIHHQGRASKQVVAEALAEANPVQALLRVNHAQWADRNERLEAITKRLVAEGKLGRRVYDPANNEFIVPGAAQASVDAELVMLGPLPPDPIPLAAPKPPASLRPA